MDWIWEYPDAKHADDFYGLMAEFRRQMDAPWAAPRERRGKALNAVDRLRRLAQEHRPDRLEASGRKRRSDRVMTYDFEGPWSHETGFVASLRSKGGDNGKRRRRLSSRGRAAAPMITWAAVLCFQWHNVTPGANNGLFSKGDPKLGSLNQSAATALLAASPGATLYRDLVSQAPWIFDGDNFLTFEDAVSLKAKAAFARELHLGGMMIPELSGDTDDARLLHALK